MSAQLSTLASTVAPLLVFGWGNPSRGDDALGPLFIERAEQMTGTIHCAGHGAGHNAGHCASNRPRVEYLTDFQLQVEHALDLCERQRVLFIDASVTAMAPFEVSTLRAAADSNVTTHAMSPSAVMQVFERLHGHAPPPCTLLAIRASRFELGEPLSDAAADNLARSLLWYRSWLQSLADEDARLAVACTN
ncbi:MAG: hydrogenase maturation protease [Gammaproteobacteria bacterium]